MLESFYQGAEKVITFLMSASWAKQAIWNHDPTKSTGSQASKYFC